MALKTALILLPGTAGELKDFDAQLKFFQHERPVLACPLMAESTLAALVEGVIQHINCFEPAQSGFVVAGHSLGGLIALELAARNVKGLRGISLIDTPMLIPAPVRESLAPLAQAFQTDAYRSTLENFANTFFFAPDDEASVRDRLLFRILDFPKDRFIALFNASGSYDANLAIRKSRVPMLYIHSGVPIDLEELRRTYPAALTITHTARSSHYSMIISADEVNSYLAAFLKRIEMELTD